MKFSTKKIIDNSEYYNSLFISIDNLLKNKYSQHDIDMVKSGTIGKIADGYAHLLDVPSEEEKKDPWIALRWLGDISNGLSDVRS